MTLSEAKKVVIKGKGTTAITVTRGHPVDNYVHPSINSRPNRQRALQAVDQLLRGISVCDPHFRMYDPNNCIQEVLQGLYQLKPILNRVGL
jgi:hypothetical protein